MCTVSFLPHSRGFYLGMNRDELLTRPAAHPPRLIAHKGVTAIHPGEPEGGTWIGISEHGICLALVNWHAVPQVAAGKLVSRGIIIPRLLPTRSLEELRSELMDMHLCNTAPFRLIALALHERRLIEVRWDGRQIEEVPHAWEAHHWFSSGYDEEGARIKRGAVCREAWREPDAGRLQWLRRLHASHKPERGPFSICMHREEAATVSYTEIDATPNQATMSYLPGPLCNEIDGTATNLRARHERATLMLGQADRAITGAE